MTSRHNLRFAWVSLVVSATLLVFGNRVTLAQEASPVASPVAGESIELKGLITTPSPITVADFLTRTAESIDVTLMSGKGEQHRYTGVRLWDVLDRAGI